LQNGADALASTHNCKHLEGLKFRAMLVEGGAEGLESARA
jgi:hypothetical protein